MQNTFMKQLFAPPSHRTTAWIQLIVGLLFISISFRFLARYGMNTGWKIYIALGLAQFLVGLADLLPLQWTKPAGGMRIVALLCTLIGAVFAFLLWYE